MIRLLDRLVGGVVALLGAMLGVLAIGVVGALIVKVATEQPLLGVAGAMLVSFAIGYVAGRG